MVRTANGELVGIFIQVAFRQNLSTSAYFYQVAPT